MTSQPNFYIIPSSLNFDIQTAMEKKLRNFGFYSLNSEISADCDIVIAIMPGDSLVYSRLELLINQNKNIFVVGKEAINSDYIEKYNSLSEYKNVFIIDEFEKSYGIIHKHMLELKNVYKHIELEQCDNKMQ